jgi:short-subunit dehydrogenase
MNGIALITGASSGLGIAFAHDLAARGYDLALTARSGAAMETLAAELRQKHGITAFIHPMDMSEPGSASRLVKSLDDQGITPAVLINNAGIGLNAKFTENAARLAAMLQLNMIQPTELTQVLARRMLESKGGHILFVASMAAYQPCPGMAAYGASKSYILSLGEALAVEFAPFVGVTVLSPGLMNTGFNAASGFKTSKGLERTILSTTRVARIGLEAMFACRSGVIAGRLNASMAFASRFLSRHTLAKQAQRMTAVQ